MGNYVASGENGFKNENVPPLGTSTGRYGGGKVGYPFLSRRLANAFDAPPV